MTINPVSAPTRTANPAPARSVDRAAPQDHDSKALADEFAAAAKRGKLPLGSRSLPRTSMTGETVAEHGSEGDKMVPPNAMPHRSATSLPRSSPGAPDSLSEIHRDDSATSSLFLQSSGPGNPLPVQAPPPGAAHVDPSAFADMLTRLWTREQGRTSREVRVSFGDEAWPATGARLLRLDDGSLQVTVSLGQRGADISGGLDGLRNRMAARGISIADIVVEDDFD